MKNFSAAMFDDTIGLLKLGIIVVVLLIIIGVLSTIPGTSPEIKAIAEQTSNSISWLFVFVIGLPSVGIIVAVIVWVRKKVEENNFYGI